MMLRQLMPHTMWPLKIHYAPKFIQINKSLWLVDCTFVICSEKCEVQTTSHKKDSAKRRHVSSHTQPTCRGDKTAKLRVNWQSHVFAYRQVSLKVNLMDNYTLMWLENIHHFLNLCNNFLFMSHRWFTCTLIFCRRLAESDITVTSSVCKDWLHQWYNHAVHSVSSSTALIFLTTWARDVNLHHLVHPSEKLVKDNWYWRQIRCNTPTQKRVN